VIGIQRAQNIPLPVVLLTRHLQVSEFLDASIQPADRSIQEAVLHRIIYRLQG